MSIHCREEELELKILNREKMETLERREGFSFRGFGGNDRWETWRRVIGTDVESDRDLGFL